MAFPRVEKSYKNGEKGEAQVRGDKKTIRLRFEKTKNVFTFRRTKKTAKLFPGRWFVGLSGDESEIYSFHPWNGQFTGKTVDFPSKEGEPPVPRLKNVDFYKDDGTHVKYSYQYFVVLVGILTPEKLSGISVPYTLNYNFLEHVDDEGNSIAGLMSKGSRTKELEDYLRATGVDKGNPIRWRDNILPTLEKRILRLDKEFGFNIENGWISSVFSLDKPEIEMEDLDWDEDNPEETSEPEPEVEENDEEEIDWELDE